MTSAPKLLSVEGLRIQSQLRRQRPSHLPAPCSRENTLLVRSTVLAIGLEMSDPDRQGQRGPNQPSSLAQQEFTREVSQHNQDKHPIRPRHPKHPSMLSNQSRARRLAWHPHWKPELDSKERAPATCSPRAATKSQDRLPLGCHSDRLPGSTGSRPGPAATTGCTAEIRLLSFKNPERASRRTHASSGDVFTDRLLLRPLCGQTLSGIRPCFRRVFGLSVKRRVDLVPNLFRMGDRP